MNFAKVMFSQVSVCPGGRSQSLSKGVSIPRGLCPGVSVQGVTVLGVSITETRPYANERAVRILLKCILVGSSQRSRMNLGSTTLQTNDIKKNKSTHKQTDFLYFCKFNWKRDYLKIEILWNIMVIVVGILWPGGRIFSNIRGAIHGWTHS